MLNKKLTKNKKKRNKQKAWKGKKMYGLFARDLIVRTAVEDRWIWMEMIDLKIETETSNISGRSLKDQLYAVQYRQRYRQRKNAEYMVRGMKRYCTLLANAKNWHNMKLARMINWNVSGNYGLQTANTW